MDMLRLTLLLIGLAVIAGIYLYYRDPADDTTSPLEDKPTLLARLKSLFARKPDPVENDEDWIRPKITEEDFEQLGSMVALRTGEGEEFTEEMHIDWDSSTPVAPEDEVVIIFHIMAAKDSVFSGHDLGQALQQAGFIFGEKQIYHYFGELLTAECDAICSLANILEPGYFEPETFDSFSSPGITLFMQLPGPLEARKAFEVTLDKARELSTLLGGELSDESHNILTEQTIGHLKEKIESFRFKQQVAAIKQRRQER